MDPDSGTLLSRDKFLKFPEDCEEERREKAHLPRKTNGELTWHGEIIVGDEDGIRIL
jgi:hypothetical protein